MWLTNAMYPMEEKVTIDVLIPEMSVLGSDFRACGPRISIEDRRFIGYQGHP